MTISPLPTPLPLLPPDLDTSLASSVLESQGALLQPALTQGLRWVVAPSSSCRLLEGPGRDFAD